MEAMKTMGKTIRKPMPQAQAPIRGGKAGLTFDQIRSIRTMLISYRQNLEASGKDAEAYNVDARICELTIAIREVM